MHVTTRAVLTAAAAAAVAAAGVFGEPWLTAVSVLVALGFATGWPRLLRLPAPQGSAVVVALGGAGGVLAVSLTRGDPVLRGLPEVVALAVLLAFVNELVRTDGRRRLVESVAGGVSGVLIGSAAAGWPAALRTPADVGLVVTGALALFFAAAASAVPFGGWTAAGITVFAGALGGLGAGIVMAPVGPAAGTLLGLAVGLLVAVLHVLLDRVPALARRSASVAALLLPVSVSGILVYIVGRVLLG
ncbi:hypothetical protein Q6348_04420 [Isoptericola sp. b441]|uniref:Permease n=1 Tax=Actinotalea lenta TaxID=3064654 RepID=A0ABT9DAW5_9CELL|nr:MULTISPECIES: hypothetical protein [unclassified Isoptericola]MDO8106436.1 hypothetical protein [Isoptericola sp. b441]MDO8121848.1 hypothetical protein [Isoptericola sp. b490]